MRVFGDTERAAGEDERAGVADLCGDCQLSRSNGEKGRTNGIEEDLPVCDGCRAPELEQAGLVDERPVDVPVGGVAGATACVRKISWAC